LTFGYSRPAAAVPRRDARATLRQPPTLFDSRRLHQMPLQVRSIESGNCGVQWDRQDGGPANGWPLNSVHKKL
ncbi:MAG: hypothetical protein P8127_08570, partial [Acidobacteriota bacterium]